MADKVVEISEGVHPASGIHKNRIKDSGGTKRQPADRTDLEKLIVGGGKVGYEAAKLVSKGLAKGTDATLRQLWKQRRDVAMAAGGAIASLAVTHPSRSLDITKEVSGQGLEQTARVINFASKLPSEEEFDRLTVKEGAQVDFFELTFPWLNESEKLKVRILADEEKVYLKENYPSDTAQRVYEWTPLVEATAQRYGVPFKYVRGIVFVESAGDPNAYNEESGAAGLGQVLESTAIAMGYTSEDRYDPEKNLEMVSIYLRDFHEQTGLWPEDVVIFHAGAGNWDFIKRTAFENKGVVIPTTVTDEDARFNATVQREATFHHKIGPIQVEIDTEVQKITKNKVWNVHGKYLLRVFAAEELVGEYERGLENRPLSLSNDSRKIVPFHEKEEKKAA